MPVRARIAILCAGYGMQTRLLSVTTWRAPGRELALVVLAALAYVGVRAITQGSTADAVANGRRVLDLERNLGIAWEHAAQTAIVGHDAVVTLANWVYIWGHWPLIVVVGTILFVRRRRSYLLLRRAMMVSGALGFLFFALLPVAPPRLMPLALVDTVAERSESYRALQPPALTNPYAALPSLHFGWNLLVGIVLFATFTVLAVRVFAVLMPVAMAISVVVTANHYVIDVLVGGLLVLLALAVAASIPATLAAPDATAPLRDRPPSRQRLGRATAHGGAGAPLGRG
jgi:hypothetical protein